MAILITGGDGFIGSRLTDFLKKQGRKIILFDADLANKKAVLDFDPIEPIDIIIHLAGVIGSRNKKLFQLVNVEGTKNILKLGQKLGVKKIVFISSLRVDSSLSDPYIESKREAEKIIMASGEPYIILRPSFVYGPGDTKNLVPLLKLIKMLPIVPLFDFSWQPIFVDDVASAIAISLELPANKIINLSGGKNISYRDLIEELRQKGFKIKTINAPRLFGALLKLFSRLPFSPIAHWQIKTLLVKEKHLCGQGLTELGIKETSFNDGLTALLKSL